MVEHSGEFSKPIAGCLCFENIDVSNSSVSYGSSELVDKFELGFGEMKCKPQSHTVLIRYCNNTVICYTIASIKFAFKDIIINCRELLQ